MCVSGPISQLDEGKDSRKGPTVAVDLPTGQTLLQVLIVGTSTEEETTGCPKKSFGAVGYLTLSGPK